MRALRILAARFRALFRRDVIAGEIREELDFHLQARIEHFERQGLSASDARHAARERVGNLALHQDRGYDVRGGGVMETTWQDVRYAVRLFRRQPGFTVVAVLTLALGIGASTAIFSVIDAALLRPLPYPAPEQLVEVEIRVKRSDRSRASDSWPRVAEVRQLQHPGSPLLAAAASLPVLFDRILDTGELERVNAVSISHDWLAVHGLSPALGRGFTADDTRAGAAPVAMLGYGYWQRRYGGDVNVIGTSIRYDGRPATIVGVMPEAAERFAIWLPLTVPADDARTMGSMIGRLRPGVSIDDAQRRLSALVSPRPAPEGISQTTSVRLRPLLDQVTRNYPSAVALLSAAVAMMLLIACVNVAGLLLARGATRQAELAVRTSIGAGRLRLIRQLLVESLVLAVAGGAAGVGLAWLLLDTLVANLWIELPSNSPAELNGAVLAVSLGLAIVTGCLVGILPALRLSRVSPAAVMASGRRGHGAALTRRGGQQVIAAEVALAVVLVAGAGLMIRSFGRLLDVDLGFDPDAIVTVEATIVDPNPAVQAQFYQQLLERLRALPEIEAAGAIDHLPLGESGSTTSVTVDGRSDNLGVSQVMPGYFEAMGLRVRGGRRLTEADYSTRAPVALLNETAARQLFADESPIGRQLTARRRTYTVVGVVADVTSAFGRASDHLFLPFDPDEQGRYDRWLTIVVRPRAISPGLADRLRDIAQQAGARVLVERIRRGGDWLTDRIATPRERTLLLSLLGGIGLVLALVGVFGMTAYAVARRTQEIGVRMAFGARPRAVVWQMLGDSAVPIAIGTIVGVGGAAFATRLISSFLFQTDPIEPVTFSAVAALLMGAGCLAAWIPARRAARVDPILALRAE